MSQKNRREMRFDNMTDIQIRELCNQFRLPLIGIFMRDDPLSTKSKLQDGCYVLNLDESGGAGTHWCGFVVDKKRVFYFDSYGVAPPQTQVVLFHNMKMDVFFNDEQVQAMESTKCGAFVVMFFVWFYRQGLVGKSTQRVNNSLNEYFDVFEQRDNYTHNDSILLTLFSHVTP